MDAKLRSLIVKPTQLLHEVLVQMDDAGEGILLVVDDSERLLGIVTDGDIRRSLMKGQTHQIQTQDVMNKDFSYCLDDITREKAIQQMKASYFRHMPVLDRDRRLKSIYLLSELDFKKHTNSIVLVAGGLGTRLRPLTENTPKPMLLFGGKPLLEHIINKFMEQGFSSFNICVNYLADQIEEYFSDGSSWGVSIKYIKEEKRLGTAGGLSLIQEELTEPIIVKNADLITNMDFNDLLNFHNSKGAAATMCVRNYEVQVPYGVVQTNGELITDIVEKPVSQYWVNAGIYVFEPQCLKYLQYNEYIDMPCFFKKIIEKNLPAQRFPVDKFWIDIGQREDYERGQVIFG